MKENWNLTNWQIFEWIYNLYDENVLFLNINLTLFTFLLLWLLSMNRNREQKKCSYDPSICILWIKLNNFNSSLVVYDKVYTLTSLRDWSATYIHSKRHEWPCIKLKFWFDGRTLAYEKYLMRIQTQRYISIKILTETLMQSHVFFPLIRLFSTCVLFHFGNCPTLYYTYTPSYFNCAHRNSMKKSTSTHWVPNAKMVYKNHCVNTMLKSYLQ